MSIHSTLKRVLHTNVLIILVKWMVMCLFCIIGTQEAFAQVSVTGTVGTLGPSSYTTLKGAFDAINGGTHKGVINITISANTTETATAQLNESGNSGSSYTAVTIKPATGTDPVVSGSIGGASLVRLSRASNVTIDGSNNGTASRNLSFSNTGTSNMVILLGSNSNAILSNVTLKNCNISGAATTSGNVGITVANNGASPTSTSGGSCLNIIIQNDSIYNVYSAIVMNNSGTSALDNGSGTIVSDNSLNRVNGIGNMGITIRGFTGVTVSNNTIGNFNASVAEKDMGIQLLAANTNTTVSGNTITNLGYTSTSSYGPYGIDIENAISPANITVSDNIISNLYTYGTQSVVGIYLGQTATTDVAILRNKVSNIKNFNSGSSYSATGMYIASNSATANVTIANNFVSDIVANGNSTSFTFNSSNCWGIVLDKGAGYNVLHNTVVLNTPPTNTSGTHRSSALLITTGVSSTANSIVVTNNIFANTQIPFNANSCFAVSTRAAITTTVFDYNDYYSNSGNLFCQGGASTIWTTLAQVRTNIDNNDSSVNVLPVFVGANDLHLVTNSNNGIHNKGIALASVTNDIDLDTRTIPRPDMGADEMCVVPLQPGTISGNIAVCPSSTQTYSVLPVLSAVTYYWILPSGWSGTSTTNSINVLTGTTGGTISVAGINSCGDTGLAQTLAITISGAPAMPGAITGANPACAGTSQTYSVAAVTGATSYTWTLPFGWTGTSTTNSITTTAGSAGGTISVTANSSCGNSAAQTLVVTVTAIPAMPGAISGNASVCGGTSQTYTVPSVAGATSYTWTIPTGWTGTSTTNSITVTAGTTGGTISVTAGNSCGNSAAQTIAVTVTNIPATPGAIAGSASVCAGSVQTYSVAGASSYTWTLPSGWSGSSSTNSINVIAGTTGGTITVTANNICGNSATQSLVITVTTVPPTPGAISGNTSFCIGSNQTYSVAAVAGATSYTWVLPPGWTGSSTTNTINAVAGPNSGLVSVTANNGCGAGTAATLAVTLASAPATPAAITGNASVCGGTSQTYSIAGVTGATSYTWTLPGGWTGTSTTSSITATAGTVGGNVTVVANNSCGSSTAQTLAVTVTNIPVTPGAMTGSTSVCGGVNQTYSITAVPGAVSYTWTLPSGWSGSSTTNSINVITGTAGGSITVTASNICGTSSVQSLVVAVTNIPATPGTITGNTAVCGGLSQTYSVAAVAGATSYTWVLPSGWTGTSTTNSITTTVGTNSGTITVTANNTCGNSLAQSLAVTVTNIPATPGTISGNASVCGGTSQTYSVAAVAGATSYIWVLPSGWTGTSTTNSITTTAGTSGGAITVRASNTCGNSAIQSLTITVTNIPATPGAITGSTSVCGGVAQTYSVAVVAGATSYTWVLPSGWSGTSTTNTISATPGTTGGTITVTANNACGNSAAQSLAVTVTNIPATPGAITGGVSVCGSTSQTYSVAAVAGATSYTWTLPAGWSGTSTTNSNTLTTGTASGTITVKANNTCGASAAQSLAITITNIPVMPGTISGNTAMCGATTQPYSITAISNATSYTWTLPLGWTGTSTTNNITTVSSNNSGAITVTANNVCGASAPQTLAVTVSPAVIPVVTVSTSSTTVCNAAPTTFTAVGINGGSNPSWQWYVNGFPQGITTTTYTTSTLSNNDVVTAIMTSNAGCLTSQTTGVSNAMTITVTPNTVPGINVNATTPLDICAGTSVTYFTNITGGGTAPQYQWLRNNSPVGNNAPTYTNAALGNGDTIRCVLTSNAICPSWTTISSNKLGMNVNTVVTPTATVTASPGTIVGIGTFITYTGVITEGGTAPLYQWYKNGQSILGATNASYTTNEWQNNDQIWVQLVSNAKCAFPTQITSNKLNMHIHTGVTAVNNGDISLTLAPNPNNGKFSLMGEWDNIPTGKKMQLEIVNTIGQVIYTERMDTPMEKKWNIMINMHDISSGMYILRLAADGRVAVKRFEVAGN